MLETEFDTDEGTVRVIDFMPPRGDAPDVVRIVEGVRGTVPMRMELRLRFDYGQVERLLALRNDVGLLSEEYARRLGDWSATSHRRSATCR